jgi:endonuclease G, mitochondrial
MGIIEEQIKRARERAIGFDVVELVSRVKDLPPTDIASEKQKRDRLAFLETTLQDTELARGVFERIVEGNELQDINYLPRGEIVSRSICRIALKNTSGVRHGWATGFLISPRVLLTNYHVFPDEISAFRSTAQFQVEKDISGSVKRSAEFSLNPKTLFFADKELDFAVVAVDEISSDSVRLSEFGYLPIVGQVGKAVDGEWLTVIQHPNGALKQVCIRENKLLKRTADVLWYSTDTLAGSSGSPVFNNEWYVVALHHSGIPSTSNGYMQTLDGTNYDATADPDMLRIKWIANEGIRISRIVERLAQTVGSHQLIAPIILKNQEKAPSLPYSLPYIAQVNTTHPLTSSLINKDQPMSQIIHLTIQIDSAGKVVVGNESLSAASKSTFTSLVESAKSTLKSAKKAPKYDAPFDNDYSKRKGFQEAFLDTKKLIHLPELSNALKKVASPLLEPFGTNKNILHYLNYSIVMNAKRRFAIYTAANVRADQRFDLNRPADVWRIDPRIDLEHQVSDFYYKRNQFDRGHLTRREDLEFGKSISEALSSAGDTCHWTNCTPQHAKFNQNKELWQGIERHLLEGAIKTNFYNTQVFTGPLFSEDDPVYDSFPEIQYPVRYWKVVTTLKQDKTVFATAYLLDQSEVIAEYGIDESTEEIPFEAYKTFQVKISEIERLTGLKFGSTIDGKKHDLSDFDPLETSEPTSKRSRRRFDESTSVSQPHGYRELLSTDDIWTG